MNSQSGVRDETHDTLLRTAAPVTGFVSDPKLADFHVSVGNATPNSVSRSL